MWTCDCVSYKVNEAGIQPSPQAARIFIYCNTVAQIHAYVCMYQVHAYVYVCIFVYCNTVAQILVFLSSCSNPVIYGIFNQNYSQCACLQFFVLLASYGGLAV